MKRIVIMAVLLSAINGWSQQEFGLYTIRGETVNLPSGSRPFIIYYSSYSCHNCMKDLVAYYNQISHDSSDLQIYIMIPGRDVFTMRQIASGLQEFFVGTEMPLVVYDLNKDTTQRFETKYHIERFPCLFVYDHENRCHYFSYDTLFSKRSFRQKKIAPFVK